MKGVELTSASSGSYQPLLRSPTEKPDKSSYQAIDGHAEAVPASIETPQTTTVCSAITIVLCVLVGDMARGVLFPTLWLRVSSLGGNKMHQGIAVSAFSMGRILSSPLFGKLSEIYGYRGVLCACNVIIVMGCLLYSVAQSISIVLLAQLIVGFGAGSLGVTRAFVAEYTIKQNRTVYMAYLT